MKSLEKLKEKDSPTAFDKDILSYMEFLHPYVKHRLYVAESKGILPRNLYNSTGIIDDAILKIYEDNLQEKGGDTKLLLFKVVDDILKSVFAKEIQNSNTENSDDFLKGELQSLEIEYFVDAGNEVVLYKDLDDISYNQQNDFDMVYQDETANTEVISTFDLHNEVYHSDNATVGNFYKLLPECVSSIIDLKTFGKLTETEIAKLYNLDVKKVENVVNDAVQQFKEHMH
ncbi:hypothetical protein JM658_01570 [Joostella atrarenae]|uniref:Uncharacterized protein n=1 Tax=Joostella atrarenae TaxID=679257 RepID=A0ABS9IZA2_9FLAO|nr:hypothetical protein [Joostella atrarenae]MCF8713502.1 hypothetical protein [Joostella atrarenae]